MGCASSSPGDHPVGGKAYRAGRTWKHHALLEAGPKDRRSVDSTFIDLNQFCKILNVEVTFPAVERCFSMFCPHGEERVSFKQLLYTMKHEYEHGGSPTSRQYFVFCCYSSGEALLSYDDLVALVGDKQRAGTRATAGAKRHVLDLTGYDDTAGWDNPEWLAWKVGEYVKSIGGGGVGRGITLEQFKRLWKKHKGMGLFAPAEHMYDKVIEICEAAPQVWDEMGLVEARPGGLAPVGEAKWQEATEAARNLRLQTVSSFWRRSQGTATAEDELTERVNSITKMWRAKANLGRVLRSSSGIESPTKPPDMSIFREAPAGPSGRGGAGGGGASLPASLPAPQAGDASGDAGADKGKPGRDHGSPPPRGGVEGGGEPSSEESRRGSANKPPRGSGSIQKAQAHALPTAQINHTLVHLAKQQSQKKIEEARKQGGSQRGSSREQIVRGPLPSRGPSGSPVRTGVYLRQLSNSARDEGGSGRDGSPAHKNFKRSHSTGGDRDGSDGA